MMMDFFPLPCDYEETAKNVGHSILYLYLLTFSFFEFFFICVHRE